MVSVRRVAPVLLLMVTIPLVAATKAKSKKSESSSRPPRELHLVGDHWTPYLSPDPATYPPAAGSSASAALGRLQSMPLQAQSVISGALGSGAAAFAAQHRPGGYELAGGGVRADLNGRGADVRVSGGSFSMTLSGVGRYGRLLAPGRASASA